VLAGGFGFSLHSRIDHDRLHSQIDLRQALHQGWRVAVAREALAGDLLFSSADASSVEGISRPSVLAVQGDDELELGRTQHWQIGRLLALEDADGLNAGLA
jgi:hypothetical protein